MVTADTSDAASLRAPRRFYADALTEAERTGLAEALAVEGVDEEIAVLRLRLRSALEQRPADLLLMFKGVELLARAVGARYKLSKPAQAELSLTIEKVLRELGGLWPLEENDARDD
jgi:hypothetical protein